MLISVAVSVRGTARHLVPAGAAPALDCRDEWSVVEAAVEALKTPAASR
jgi:hypothetical protein